MDTKLALRPIEQAEWGVMREQAKVLITTGFLPEAIKTAEQAIAIMMKARELGLPPMYGLSNIVVIKGKPAASAELMLALIYRDHGDEAIRFTETNAQKCTIRYKRRNWTQPETYSFTTQDAEAAGLLSNNTWKQYRPAMLRARCISAVARMGFPDTIGGLYTPEELGATVAVSDSGEIAVAELPADAPVIDADVVLHEATKVIAQASSKRAVTTWEDRYDELSDKADSLGIPHKTRSTKWSRDDGVAEGKELAAKVKAAKDAIPSK